MRRAPNANPQSRQFWERSIRMHRRGAESTGGEGSFNDAPAALGQNVIRSAFGAGVDLVGKGNHERL